MPHDLISQRNADPARPAPVTSARDARSSGVPHASSDACAAGFFEAGAGRRRAGQPPTHRARVAGALNGRNGWRLAAVVYIVVALAAPLLLYAGPDVLSPVAPSIAGEALHGDLPLHLH